MEQSRRQSEATVEVTKVKHRRIGSWYENFEYLTTRWTGIHSKTRCTGKNRMLRGGRALYIWPIIVEIIGELVVAYLVWKFGFNGK